MEKINILGTKFFFEGIYIIFKGKDIQNNRTCIQDNIYIDLNKPDTATSYVFVKKEGLYLNEKNDIKSIDIMLLFPNNNTQKKEVKW